MSETHEGEYGDISRRLEALQHAKRLRILVASLIPTLVGAILVWQVAVSYGQADRKSTDADQKLQQADQKLATVGQQIDLAVRETRSELDRTRGQLVRSSDQLRQAQRRVTALRTEADEARVQASSWRGQVEGLTRTVSSQRELLAEVHGRIEALTETANADPRTARLMAQRLNELRRMFDQRSELWR